MSSREFIILTTLIIANALIIAAYLLGKRIPLRKLKQPSCRWCGYPATGLESFTCPECGKDLRQVGIITTKVSKRRKPISLLLTWFLWTALLLAPFAILNSYLLIMFQESERTVDQSVILSKPQSNAYDHITITVKANAFQWPWQRLPYFAFFRENIKWKSPPNEYGDLGSTNIHIYTSNHNPPSAVVNYDPESGVAVIHSTNGTQLIHPPGKVLKDAITLAYQESGIDTKQNAINNDVIFTLSNTGQLIGPYSIITNQRIQRSAPIAIITVLKSINTYKSPDWLGYVFWVIVACVWLVGINHYRNQYHTESTLKRMKSDA